MTIFAPTATKYLRAGGILGNTIELVCITTSYLQITLTFRPDVNCFEVCVFCHRRFTDRSTDFLAHQHVDPTATATYAAAVATKKDENEDEEDDEDNVRDNESRKVYMAERREQVLKKVERSLKRAERKRKPPPTGDPLDAIRPKKSLLLGDRSDKGDPSKINHFDSALQPETSTVEPVPRPAKPYTGTKSSGGGRRQPSMVGRCDNADASPGMYVTELSKVLPEGIVGGSINQHSLAGSNGFAATGEASPERSRTNSSSTKVLSGHYMAEVDQQLLAGSEFDIAGGDLLGDVDAVSRLLQELPDVHARFNYGWEDVFPQTGTEGEFRQT